MGFARRRARVPSPVMEMVTGSMTAMGGSANDTDLVIMGTPPASFSMAAGDHGKCRRLPETRTETSGWFMRPGRHGRPRRSPWEVRDSPPVATPRMGVLPGASRGDHGDARGDRRGAVGMGGGERAG